MKTIQWKAFTKKVTACALAAAMILSTPFMAFATEFSDNFAPSDDANKNSSYTESIGSGTVSESDTTVINENIVKIKDLIIYGQKEISVKPGKKTVLTAALLADTNNNVVLKKLNERIMWKTDDPKIVSIDRDPDYPNKCILNPRNAGTTKITATLTVGTYNEEGKIESVKNTLTASVDVTVFNPQQEEFVWNITDKFYVKGTYCLSNYLIMNGVSIKEQVAAGSLKSVSDVVTYAINGSSKAVTINGDTLTVKKAGEEITLLAILPDGTKVPSATITTEAGNPIKKLAAVEKTKLLDFGMVEKEGTAPTDIVEVEVTPTDEENPTTDKISWTSSNPLVVRIVGGADSTSPSDRQTKVQIQAENVGKATITAKATSGKTAKINVTVKATLVRLEITQQGADEYAWSGKTEELKIKRIPVQNKDKLKVTVYNKKVKCKSTAGSVTITPANDLKLGTDEDAVTVGEGDNAFQYIPVELSVETTDKNSERYGEPIETTIKVRQSDFEIGKLTDITEDPESSKEIKGKNPVVITQLTEPNITFKYKVEPTSKHAHPDADVVSWVSSNPKVAVISGKDGVGDLTIVGSGTAKITVSSIYEKSKGKYAQSKKTFTIKSTPKCETIELKSTAAIYDMKKQKAVTINIKQQLPKKANDPIEWYVNGVKKKKDKRNVTDKKITLQPSEFRSLEDGATVEVMAVSEMDGNKPKTYAVATVYVVKTPAKKIAFSTKYKKGVILNVGEIRSDIPAPSIEPKAVKSDVISYTVDKKGANVVSIEEIEKVEVDKTGKLVPKNYIRLTGIGEGKATVTAITASGKKATLKVTVKKASGSK